MSELLTIGYIQSTFPTAVTIVAHAPMLHAGWEMDNDACAVTFSDGSIMLISTSHGRVYKMDIEDLQEKIIEYDTAAKACRNLLLLVTG